MSGDLKVTEITNSFMTVRFPSIPGAGEYEQACALEGGGWTPISSPREINVSRHWPDPHYLVTFQRAVPLAEPAPIPGREDRKTMVRHCIHHLRSLLDSEKDFEESSLVATKAYEALEKL